MSHRKAILEFGAARGMNTYLYAPKDDPYHRERWIEPYPAPQWKALLKLIRHAQTHGVDFVYGFHPGKGLYFSQDALVVTLLGKARRFYDAGVKTFAVLFDDIPSYLEFDADRKHFRGSLARAESTWLAKIQEMQPPLWRDIEWWICPSYYSFDPALPRVFGRFEPNFLETLGEHLPPSVAVFWTGPSVVSKTITFTHVQRIATRLKHRILVWDNYPVNDLAMADELHLGPLRGRDRKLPLAVYGYLNNPLLQEDLSFIPLATCLDYAADPTHYKPESSWSRIICELYGSGTLPYWQTLRRFCERLERAKKTARPLSLKPSDRQNLQLADDYIRKHRWQKWSREIHLWRELLQRQLHSSHRYPDG